MMLLSRYLPMVGLILAFKRFSVRDGIFGSKFVGFQNFEFLGVVGLPFLKYKEVLEPTPVRTIIEYDSE